MKKKKILNSIIFVVFIVALGIFAYNLFMAIRGGNQYIDLVLGKEYSQDTGITATVNVYDEDDRGYIERGNVLSLKSKVTMELYDSNHKKVKHTKVKYNVDEGETLDAKMDLPNDLESGIYYVKFKVSSKKGVDKFEKSIVINNSDINNLVISLDKGIYKPGDEVNFRGMLLSKSDDTPIETEMNISIYDGNSNKVYNQDVKTSEYGITSGTFKLANEVNSGMYKLVFSVGNQEFSKQFKVNPYVLPKFEVNVSKDKDTYNLEETAKIKIDSKYFFGEPVINASVEIDVDGRTSLGVTNSDGIFEYELTSSEPKTYNIGIKVTDESNYMIEASTGVIFANTKFNIELLPEYGEIYEGVNNDIYVYTTNLDGTPLKTYTTISCGGFNRQVITDENGIGVFSLTSDDIRNMYTRKFNIVSKNMNEQTEKLNYDFNVKSNSGTLIKTNKVKYNQGEDIKIKLNSRMDISNKNLCVCKNSKVIQNIKTNEEEVKINLGDTYGLVTIYTLDSRNQIENKRTVFIMPDKKLNLNLATDNSEYKPGDEMKLSVELTDKNGNKVDGAILVSILDEAILSLATNDLTIDNLMLSLQDIEFDNNLDLASVYSTILEENNESVLMGLLLKQSNTAPSFSQDSFVADVSDYWSTTIMLAIVIFSIALIYFLIISENVRRVVQHLIALVIWCFAVWMSLTYLDILEDHIFVNLFIGIVTYFVFIKHSDFILTTGLEMIVIPIIIRYAVEEISYFEIVEVAIVLGIAIASIIKIVKDIKSKKLKPMTEILKIAYGIVVIFGFEDDPIPFLLGFIAVCLYHNIKNNVAEKKKENNKKIQINIDSSGVVALGIVLVLIIVSVIRVSKTSTSTIDVEYEPYISDGHYYKNENSNKFTLDMASTNNMNSKGDSAEMSERNKFDFSIDAFSMKKSDSNSIKEESVEVNIENSVKEDENIRNVFLESLCFIPELVTENGKAEQNIKLSDNITTWQIQTIANTKDGNLGYATGNIKVFKEFFVDFSMPTNSVVGDKISLPVTVYNYTDGNLNIELNIKEDSWFTLGEYNSNVEVEANSTKMVYVPLEILSAGNNSLQIEGKAGEVSDIIKLSMETKPNGVEVSKVLNSGILDDDISLDAIFMQDAIENTENIKVKLYPSTISTIIEGMDNIFKMPTGCFEQTSSSLYPNIVALKYMEDNNIIDGKVKAKALEYISSGYQRILTFEVPNEKGGYSLYGHAPAETVLTAYGLMELKDLTDVYSVDENVINNMKEFLFKQQNLNGTFEMSSDSSYSTSHVVSNTDEVSLNAYVTWALSECYPDDSRLEASLNYLEDNLDKIKDNYTLALVANAFANTKNKNTDKVIKRLVNNVSTEDNQTYMKSDICDYWGSRGSMQNIQVTALTSIALSKTSSNAKTNKNLIEYIISKKDSNGTWGTTQGTILALKALNVYSSKNKITKQDINVKLNDEVKTITIDKNSLDLYEVDFKNVNKENKISIDIEKGELYYEVIQNYYVSYEDFGKDREEYNTLSVESEIGTEFNVNDKVIQTIKIENSKYKFVKEKDVIEQVDSKEKNIENGLVEIKIPQGFSVSEESLSKLETQGFIEKYEYNYNSIYLYLRKFYVGSELELKVEYIANYPETITGGMVRVYDYYNPDVDDYTMPVTINVK